MKFEVFGRRVQVMATDDGWRAYYLSGDGKRRKAQDIVIPSHLGALEIERYLGDLCHEWASSKYPNVRSLE